MCANYAKILIAEDEVIERQYLSQILDARAQGLRVVGAVADGAELLQAHEKLRPDVIVADIRMPVLSGLEACRMIRRDDEKVILLINSAYADFAYAQEALNQGVDAYLLKPSDRDNILRVIRSLLGKRQRKIPMPPLEAETLQLFQQMYQAVRRGEIASLCEAAGALQSSLVHWEHPEQERLLFINFLLSLREMLAASQDLKILTELLEIRLYLERLQEAADLELLSLYREFLERLALGTRLLQPEAQSTVQRLETYLCEHYLEALDLTELERVFFLKGPYLSKLYRQEYGKTIAHRLQELRLMRAKGLLESSQLAIQEVAARSGFQSLSQFYRCFRQNFGQTPYQFRRRLDWLGRKRDQGES